MTGRILVDKASDAWQDWPMRPRSAEADRTTAALGAPLIAPYDPVQVDFVACSHPAAWRSWWPKP